MLREAFSPEGGTSQASHLVATGRGKLSNAAPACPRLLVLQAADKRVAALQAALGDLHYSVAGITLAGAPASPPPAPPPALAPSPPDVLIAALDPQSQDDVVAFARRCQGLWPSLLVVYLTWVTWNAPEPLLPRERVLQAPFTGEDLANLLARL
jgi:hypothetical protein